MASGEAQIHRAIRWVGEHSKDNPTAKKHELIDSACRQFNLSPLEGEFLYRFFAESAKVEGNK